MNTASGTSQGQPSREPEAAPPQDAATLVIVATGEGEPKVLMGRRRPDQVFLPNKFVFPGGRVDAADVDVPCASDLLPHETGKLMLAMKGEASHARARAIALAAVRETFEETGLIVGVRRTPASEHHAGPWQAFLASGAVPDLSQLSYFARAITPPGRSRRYDTRFFVVDAGAIAGRAGIPDGELSGIGWYSLEAARRLDLPGITHFILEDLGEWLKLDIEQSALAPVPFYDHDQGSFKRVMLSFDRLPSYDEKRNGDIAD